MTYQGFSLEAVMVSSQVNTVSSLTISFGYVLFLQFGATTF